MDRSYERVGALIDDPRKSMRVFPFAAFFYKNRAVACQSCSLGKRTRSILNKDCSAIVVLVRVSYDDEATGSTIRSTNGYQGIYGTD